VIENLASTYDGDKDWTQIAEVFNQQTKRSTFDGTCLERSQVHNAYYNHISRFKTNSSNADKALHFVSENNKFYNNGNHKITPVENLSDKSADIGSNICTAIDSSISMDIASRSSKDNDNNTTATSTFSAAEVSNIMLPDATKGQQWSKEEIDLLLKFQNNSAFRRKITGNGSSLDYIQFQKQFNWHARLYKLENPKAEVYRRTSTMIQEKIKRLRRDKIWY
jgi:hypothetical protein